VGRRSRLPVDPLKMSEGRRMIVVWMNCADHSPAATADPSQVSGLLARYLTMPEPRQRWCYDDARSCPRISVAFSR
jgi:hypothetical protein